jgi:hypothetical protein
MKSDFENSFLNMLIFVKGGNKGSIFQSENNIYFPPPL